MDISLKTTTYNSADSKLNNMCNQEQQATTASWPPRMPSTINGKLCLSSTLTNLGRWKEAVKQRYLILYSSPGMFRMYKFDLTTNIHLW
jgi:hypothetical protein